MAYSASPPSAWQTTSIRCTRPSHAKREREKEKRRKIGKQRLNLSQVVKVNVAALYTWSVADATTSSLHLQQHFRIVLPLMSKCSCCCCRSLLLLVLVVVAVVVVDFDTVLHFSLACETVSSCTGGARPHWAPPTLTATYFLIIKYTLSAPVLQHTKVQT